MTQSAGELGLRRPPPATLPSLPSDAWPDVERLRAATLRRGRLSRAVREHARALERPLRVHQIGCESGELLLHLGRDAARRGLRLELSGADPRHDALRHAERRAAKHALSVNFEPTRRLDELGSHAEGADVLLCTSVLPWLDATRALDLLTAMRATAQRAVLLEDMLRSRAAWRWASGPVRWLTRSEAVHNFALEEVRSAIDYGGLGFLIGRGDLHRNQTRVTKHWPSRVFLHWTHPKLRQAAES